jgi:hypothetical protein
MRKLIRRKATQMLTFNSMVVSAITLIVGVLIFNSVNGALPSDGTGAINATATVVPQIESAFTLAPIVLVVLIASLILAQVAQFRGGN